MARAAARKREPAASEASEPLTPEKAIGFAIVFLKLLREQGDRLDQQEGKGAPADRATVLDAVPAEEVALLGEMVERGMAYLKQPFDHDEAERVLAVPVGFSNEEAESCSRFLHDLFYQAASRTGGAAPNVIWKMAAQLRAKSNPKISSDSLRIDEASKNSYNNDTMDTATIDFSTAKREVSAEERLRAGDISISLRPHKTYQKRGEENPEFIKTMRSVVNRYNYGVSKGEQFTEEQKEEAAAANRIVSGHDYHRRKRHLTNS